MQKPIIGDRVAVWDLDWNFRGFGVYVRDEPIEDDTKSDEVEEDIIIDGRDPLLMAIITQATEENWQIPVIQLDDSRIVYGEFQVNFCREADYDEMRQSFCQN